MILGVLVVISGQMSLKIDDFCPAKVISNSRYLMLSAEILSEGISLWARPYR